MTFSPRQILTAEQMRDLEASKPHAGIAYAFASSTAEANPGDGKCRVNNGDWPSATELYLSKTDRNGNDLGDLLQSLLVPGCWLWIFAVNDQTRWLGCSLASVTDAGSYWKLGIGNVHASEARPNDGAALSINPIGALLQSYSATSSSSRAIADAGSVTFATQVGLPFLPGARVRATSRSSGAFMEGVVSEHAGASLTVVMDKSGGAGTYADWNINIAGEPGTGSAPLASPAFTGTPTAPTAGAGTNTTQLATTAFVMAAISVLLGGAPPAALDTLDELAAALGDDANFAATITNALALKAPLASPNFSGTPQVNGSNVLKAGDIGSSVQAYDANTLKKNVSDTLAAGFKATSYNAGTLSSGTLTPAVANGNIQHYTNNGAHTLAPYADVTTMIIDVTNGASAGVITTSGFTKTTGDTRTTTNGHKFRLFISVGNGGSHIHTQALQ